MKLISYLTVGTYIISPLTVFAHDREHASDRQNLDNDKILFAKSSTTSSTATCSREQSRLVRKYLEREVFPMLPIKAIELPDGCQLNPLLDLFADQEHHKIRDRTKESGAEWKCAYCKKIFKSEKYLDRHMENKHPDRLMVESSSVCLADLCPIFGCQSTRYSKDTKDFHEVEKCMERDIEKVKYRCQVLVRRCFDNLPRDMSSKENFFKNAYSSSYFQESICEKLHCSNGAFKGAAAYELDSSSDEGADSNYIIRTLQISLIFMIIMFMVIYGLCIGIGGSSSSARKVGEAVHRKRDSAWEKTTGIAFSTKRFKD